MGLRENECLDRKQWTYKHTQIDIHKILPLSGSGLDPGQQPVVTLNLWLKDLFLTETCQHPRGCPRGSEITEHLGRQTWDFDWTYLILHSFPSSQKSCTLAKLCLASHTVTFVLKINKKPIHRTVYLLRFISTKFT